MDSRAGVQFLRGVSASLESHARSIVLRLRETGFVALYAGGSVRDMLLDRAGYARSLASSGEEAVQLLEQTTPALIVLDLNMPGMDGWSVAALVRKHERTARIPVGRRLTTEEVAASVIWLALDAPDHVTAERLNASGGMDRD